MNKMVKLMVGLACITAVFGAARLAAAEMVYTVYTDNLDLCAEICHKSGSVFRGVGRGAAPYCICDRSEFTAMYPEKHA